MNQVTILKRKVTLYSVQNPGEYYIVRDTHTASRVALACPECGEVSIYPHDIESEEPLTMYNSVAKLRIMDTLAPHCGHDLFFVYGGRAIRYCHQFFQAMPVKSE